MWTAAALVCAFLLFVAQALLPVRMCVERRKHSTGKTYRLMKNNHRTNPLDLNPRESALIRGKSPWLFSVPPRLRGGFGVS